MPETILVNVHADEFGTFYYDFTREGEKFECFDFPTASEAFQGARFHLRCIWENLPHQVADGLGAIYRPEWATVAA